MGLGIPVLGIMLLQSLVVLRLGMGIVLPLLLPHSLQLRRRLLPYSEKRHQVL